MLNNWRIALIAVVPAAMFLQANTTFAPDQVFKGSTLTGWHTLGQTAWKAENGELVANAAESGGWLVLDKSYQDVAFHAYVKKAAGANFGVLLRADKTADGGMKGVYVSFADGRFSNFAVTIDGQGKELTREPLPPLVGSSWVRIAPAANAANAAGGGRGGAGGAGGAGRGAAGPGGAAGAGARGGAARGGFGGGRATPADVPLHPPDTSFKADDWNEMEVILEAEVMRSYLNAGREVVNVARDESGSYGPVALFVGGQGEVRFKDVAYKDLGIRTLPPEHVSPNYTMQHVNGMYYAWSAAAADFNKDGKLDLVAGPYIYYGPDFNKSRELYTAITKNPSTEFAYSHDVYTFDFNGDGWPDVLSSPPGAVLYINPKGESRRWEKFTIGNVSSEETVMGDIDGDGRPELIASANGGVGYYQYDPTDCTKPWTFHNVSGPGYGQPHGIGVGDVNGDGKPDILNTYGWWENPGKGSTQETWTYHPVAFAWYSRGNYGGNRMWVWDVNGDGLNDVVTVMSSHGWGIAWFEQKKDKDGKISFVEHPIMDGEGFGAKAAGNVLFTEAHGTAMGDMDDDGIPDLVVGKRYFTHLDSYLDPDPYGAPVLYVYHTVRDPKAPGGARFVPELIHNRSGAGNDITAVDLNKDGVMDIVSATNTGTYIFWGKKKAPAKAPAKKQ